MLIPRGWQKYLMIMNLAMQRALAYRWKYFISALAGLFQVVVLFFIWQFVFSWRADAHDYQWSDIRTYLFLTYLINRLLGFYVETAISLSIRDGSIIMELVRPLRYLWLRFSEAVGTALVEGIILGAVATLVAFAFFDIVPPLAGYRVLFCVALLLAFLLKFMLLLSTGLLCFWTTNVFGLVWTRETITTFFSGALIPLAFFPRELQIIASYLPFQGIIHTPIEIYLGRLSSAEAVAAIAIQAGWVLLLGLLAWTLFRRGLRAIDVYGG